MINVRFIRDGGEITGFTVSGHSGYSEEGSDIICSAVSSAAFMAANTVTEVIGLKARITEKDGFLSLELSKDEAVKAADTLNGFLLHIEGLEKQYPDYIKLERGAR